MRKYKNTFVYFDPRLQRAYEESDCGNAAFASTKVMSSDVKKRCYRFDSKHEYFTYRIALNLLPEGLQLLRQVNFLVIPGSDLGKKVFYRADLVVVTNSISEQEFRLECANSCISTQKFLVIEPKGVLTETAKLKHLVLCATNKIPVTQILFVEMNSLLTFPGETRTTLGQLPAKLLAKIDRLFTLGDIGNGN